MKNKASLLLSTTISLCLYHSIALADTNPQISRAALLANPCFACHGIDGNSVGLPIVSLQGQSAEQLSASLLAFKKGERPSTLMGRISKGYSDEDLKLIADYIASLHSSTSQ